jgi:hypothetical protein
MRTLKRKTWPSLRILGQVGNVLIILGITALMAIATTMLAYFVDLFPSALDGSTHVAASAVANMQAVSGN